MPADAQWLSPEELQDLYGPWEPWAPTVVRTRLRPARFPWWIGGGWAAEAAGAAVRTHEDTDLVILERDLPALRDVLSDHHLWEAHDGGLRPLRPGGATRWLSDALAVAHPGHPWAERVRSGRGGFPQPTARRRPTR